MSTVLQFFKGMLHLCVNLAYNIRSKNSKFVVVVAYLCIHGCELLLFVDIAVPYFLVPLVIIPASFTFRSPSLSSATNMPSLSTILVSELLLPVDCRLYLGRGIFWWCCCSYLGWWYLFHILLVMHWWCGFCVKLWRGFG